MTYKFALVPPIVNMNGATAKSLVEQHVAVLNAIDATVDAMQAAFPHGRDYQTARTAFAEQAAQDAWRERMVALVDLKREITANALAIQAQGRG